jgi:HEAT repeat protein
VPARLGPLLDHEDPEVRLDAAIALGLTRLAPAADLLRKRMDVEPVPRVRSQMGRQLRVIEDARAAAAAAR